MSAPDAATRDRYRGALLGLAAGDALGTTVEFRPPGTFAPVTDITGGGPFALNAGQWTDDTSMALCLAESLIECRGFDLADQLRRYVRWWRAIARLGGRLLGGVARLLIGQFFRAIEARVNERAA